MKRSVDSGVGSDLMLIRSKSCRGRSERFILLGAFNCSGEFEPADISGF